MAATSTERTPLNGAVPHARQRMIKIAIGGAIAAALVLGVSLLALEGPSTSTSLPSSSTVSAISSEPWTCGSTPFDAGYVKLANKKDDHFYYFFAKSSSSDPSKDPLVLWLTGGAGGSSLSALFTENGPCLVNDDGLTTRPNPFAWNQQANVIWLDQPTGVGFSYSNAIDDDADVDDLKVRIGENIYWFLQGFLEKHPELENRPFFLAGESYAGHYLPSTGRFILQEKDKPNRKRINLQGISLGNGLVDPVTQYAHHVDMAVANSYNITTLTDAQIAQMQKDAAVCIAASQACQQAPHNGSACADAVACYGTKLVGPYSLSKRNIYDIRQECVTTSQVSGFTVCGLDYSTTQSFLRQPHIRKALNVAPEAEDWVVIREAVSARFIAAGDFAFSYTDFVTDLLDHGVRVLIYNGDADLVCNWKGGDAWTRALAWNGRAGFNAATEHTFVTSENVEGGSERTFDNFTYLRVFNAGHMVPTDQPAVALDMINKFLKNQPL